MSVCPQFLTPLKAQGISNLSGVKIHDIYCNTGFTFFIAIGRIVFRNVMKGDEEEKEEEEEEEEEK